MNPLDAVWLEFSARGNWLLLEIADNLAYNDLEFADRIGKSTAYRNLLEAGVDGYTLLDVCKLFHAFARLQEQAIVNFKQRKRPLKNGRPTDLFPAFQYCCEMLVIKRNDGRRFYAEFRDLAALVYGRNISAKSYCRTLKRHLHRIPPTREANERKRTQSNAKFLADNSKAANP